MNIQTVGDSVKVLIHEEKETRARTPATTFGEIPGPPNLNHQNKPKLIQHNPKMVAGLTQRKRKGKHKMTEKDSDREKGDHLDSEVNARRQGDKGKETKKEHQERQ